MSPSSDESRTGVARLCSQSGKESRHERSFLGVGLWISGLVTVALTGAAQAAAPKPTTWLGEQVTAVRALVSPATPLPAGEQDAKLKALVDPVMEFDKLSEKALGKHWAALKPEQRKVFIDTFRELVFRSYLKKVRGANNDYTLAFEGETLSGTSAKVEAVAKTKKAEESESSSPSRRARTSAGSRRMSRLTRSASWRTTVSSSTRRSRPTASTRSSVR